MGRGFDLPVTNLKGLVSRSSSDILAVYSSKLRGERRRCSVAAEVVVDVVVGIARVSSMMKGVGVG